MPTQIPIHRIRIPALRQQCLFQRHPRPQYLAQLQPSAIRTFSSTPLRPAKRRQLGQDKAQTKAAAQGQVGPSPRVNLEKAQASTDAMAEDIGLLQNTIVRPPLRELKGLGLRAGLSYVWGFVKSRVSGAYSRYVYHGCIEKKFWKRMSAFTIDTFNNSQTKTLAKAHYKELYDNLAIGEIKPLKQFCLPPLIKKLESRIIARGKTKMEWRLHGSPKAHVVSHRAAPLGEDYPDTAYRQVIVRLASTQSLKRGDSTSAFSGPKQRTNLPWLPDSARLKISHSLQSSRKRADEGEPKKLRNKVFEDNGKAKQVVEYLVMQKRVIRGREERDWKVWGFAEESTPERIEADEEYWRRTLDLQAGGL